MVWFLLFSLIIFVTTSGASYVGIYYIPDTVIETYSAKKMSLKFLIMSKFKILTKYLKNTFKSIDLFVSCRSKK